MSPILNRISRSRFLFFVAALTYASLWAFMGLREAGFAIENQQLNRDVSVDNIGSNRVFDVDESDADFFYGESGHTTETRVAIGVAVTSKGMSKTTDVDSLCRLQLFTTLLPSFCQTSSEGFEYHFYVAYDYTDVFISTNRDKLQVHFREFLLENCARTRVFSMMHFVECRYTGKPAWAQNDAMMEAYLDDNDYYYRVNDDSLLESRRWTELFVEALAQRHPPNVGVVGPNHKGGNTDILTHDFVHKTHVDIFGFYYPRLLGDLYADTWISRVYEPGFSAKLPNVWLNHTQHFGKRYQSRPRVTYRNLHRIITPTHHTFLRYIEYRNTTATVHGRNVVAMTLVGNNVLQTIGAIRNAQLALTNFPGWTFRIYTAAKALPGSRDALVTSKRILNKLRTLGSEVVYVNASELAVPPELWPFLAMDQVEEEVEYLIVRNASGRLSRRDYSAVADWMQNGAALHYVRDIRSQVAGVVRAGLWGAKISVIRKLLPFSMRKLFSKLQRGGPLHTERLFSEYLLPFIENNALTHDSVSCRVSTLCRHFPDSNLTGVVGQMYDQFDRRLSVVHKSKGKKTHFGTKQKAQRQKRMRKTGSHR